MKRFYERNKYTIIYVLIILFAFFIGCVCGCLKTTASQTADDTVTETTTEREENTYATTEPSEKIDIGEFKLTGYCTCTECCGEYSDGYTATMTKATPGRTIAVDPEVIPYGSIVEINGDKYIAEDCGGAIKGNHIDMLCASHELAECFGVQYAEVFIIKEGTNE